MRLLLILVELEKGKRMREMRKMQVREFKQIDHVTIRQGKSMESQVQGII
jgi:hypothetical protein